MPALVFAVNLYTIFQFIHILETGQKPTVCTATGLNSGETYPTGAKSPEEVVGRLDVPVTRKDVEDFKRYVLYN